MLCEISGSHGGEYEDDSFWDTAPCSFVETDRRFKEAYCIHHEGDEFIACPVRLSSSNLVLLILCLSNASLKSNNNMNLAQIVTKSYLTGVNILLSLAAVNILQIVVVVTVTEKLKLVFK
jgi:hypothetical protein